jgi:hypothetical protein
MCDEFERTLDDEYENMRRVWQVESAKLAHKNNNKWTEKFT